jgi:hypothetical protein
MSISYAIYLALAIAAIVIFMYVILPKLKVTANAGKIGRAIIFLGVMIYLGVDFYLKEKYWYLLVLGLGTVGFLLMLKDSKPKA